MSSLAVRTLFKDFLAANSAENTVDFTAESDDFLDLLKESGVPADAPFLGLEFIGDEEIPVSLAATNDQGLYREIGQLQLHVCDIGRMGVGNSMLQRAEILRNLFRGRRIGGVVIESVTPMNTGPGATLEFEGGYVSGTISIAFYYDLTPGT